MTYPEQGVRKQGLLFESVSNLLGSVLGCIQAASLIVVAG